MEEPDPQRDGGTGFHGPPSAHRFRTHCKNPFRLKPNWEQATERAKRVESVNSEPDSTHVHAVRSKSLDSCTVTKTIQDANDSEEEANDFAARVLAARRLVRHELHFLEVRHLLYVS